MQSSLRASIESHGGLLQEINVMYDKDQEIRAQAAKSGYFRAEESLQRIRQLEQDYLPRLKEIVRQYRWPGFQLVGTEGAQRMWVLVQHCDRDIEFQKLCLRLLEEAVAQKDASKEHLAYLKDRILVNEGRPQLYGTQIQMTEGELHPHPILEPQDLDQRRAEMEMTPYAEYLAFCKKTFLLTK